MGVLNMDKKTMERIIKVIVSRNGKAEFNKQFLKQHDNCTLVVKDDGQTITLTTKFDK